MDSFDIDEADRVFCMNREAIDLVKAENFDEEEAEYETDPAFKEFYVRYFNEKDMLR